MASLTLPVTRWTVSTRPATSREGFTETPEGPGAFSTDEIRAMIFAPDTRVMSWYRPSLLNYGTAVFLVTADGVEVRACTRDFGPSETALSS